MTADLDALRTLLARTTAEPWEAREEIDGVRAGRRTVVWAHGKRVVTVDQTRPHHDGDAEANVLFIAKARSLVEDMKAELMSLRAQLTAHREFAARIDVYALHDELTPANVEALTERLTGACDLATELHGEGQ